MMRINIDTLQDIYSLPYGKDILSISLEDVDGFITKDLHEVTLITGPLEFELGRDGGAFSIEFDDDFKLSEYLTDSLVDAVYSDPNSFVLSEDVIAVVRVIITLMIANLRLHKIRDTLPSNTLCEFNIDITSGLIYTFGRMGEFCYIYRIKLNQ